MSGTAPTGAVPGSITIETKCGDIAVDSTGRIETFGVDPGGSDINLLACNGGDIVINGLVRALFKFHGAMTHLPVINVVSFEGAVTIDGNNVLGTEVLAGTKYTVTSGVIVQDYFDATAGTVNIQAKKDITVYGNALLSKYENFGAVAVKGGSNGAFGGVIDVRSLEGKIIASDRAFDNANRYNTNAKVNLLANGNIDLSVTASKNYGAADNTKAVVSTHAGIGGKGGENILRSYSGSISIGLKAQVLADGTTAGTNLLTSCTGVTNNGIVNPVPVISSNCVPPAPTGLFTDCGDFGIFCEECGQ
jgi:hypothetical protein